MSTPLVWFVLDRNGGRVIGFGDVDPTASPGLDKPSGSIYVRDTGTSVTLYVKSDGAATAWAVNGGAFLPLSGGTLTGAMTMAAVANAQIFPCNARIVGTNASGSQSGEYIPTATDGGTYLTMGTANSFHLRDSALADRVTVDASGNLTATGDGSFNSDARLKANIEPIADALALILRLRGVRFDRTDIGGRHVGLIAQDVREVVPEVVHRADDVRGTLSVAYGNLVALLVEAIKEQQQQIATFAARLDALEAAR